MKAVLRFLSFRPFTGRHMAFVICTFFGVVIAVNLFMASMAVQSWTGLIARNGYVATKHLAERAERERPAVEAGWRIDATVRDGVVAVKATDGAERPLSRAMVDAVAGRPAFEADDRVLPFEKVGYGSFVALEALPSGRWYVDVTVSEGAMELTRRFSVTVEDGRS